jgi:hypothetical protein
MDPFTAALIAVIGILGVGLALAFWQNIMEAVRTVVLPFFERIDPRLKNLVANAFIWIDKNLAVPLRAKAIKAWRTFRLRVKDVIASYKYEGDNKWIRKIIAWARQNDDTYARILTITDIPYEQVPEKIRAHHMKSGFSGWSEEISIAELRDREIEMLEELSD